MSADGANANDRAATLDAGRNIQLAFIDPLSFDATEHLDFKNSTGSQCDPEQPEPLVLAAKRSPQVARSAMPAGLLSGSMNRRRNRRYYSVRCQGDASSGSPFVHGAKEKRDWFC